MAKISKSNIKGKKAVTRTVLIPADEADVKRLEAARSAATRAKLLGNPDESAKADQELADTTTEVRENGLEFVFRGIGRKAYEALLRDNSPTDEQRADHEARKITAPQWNVDTFPAALCHAAAVDNELTAEDWVTDIFESEDWGPGELAALFNAALEANSDRRVVDLGNF